MIGLTEPVAGRSQDFAKFVELLQRFAAVDVQLGEVELEMNRAAQAAAAVRSTEYVVLQEERARIEVDLKALFGAHPEWREAKRKSVATPYGTVEQRSVCEIEIPNPLMTVALIEAAGGLDSTFDAAAFLRVSKEPDVEALERLSDERLAELGVRRVRSERVAVRPPRVSAKKVAKAATEQEKV